MALFEFTTDEVIPKKDITELKTFRKIRERDDADAIFAYIFHTCDYKSPYMTYEKEERERKLSEELLDGGEPDEDTLEAMELYRELSMTQSLKLLESARKGVYTLQNYFETEDPSDYDNPGRAAKDLMSNLNNVGKILDSLKDWEESVKKEQDQANTRKGVELGKYNQ